MQSVVEMIVQSLAIAVLVLSSWPLLRILSIPAFRKWYTCYAWRVVLILVVYGIAIVTLMTYFPHFLFPAAVVAALLMGVERWRARTRFGRSKLLPPGSLTLVPRGPWVDDQHFQKLAKRHGPVFKTSQYFFPMVCVVGAKRGIALMSEHGDKLQPPEIRFNQFIPLGLLRYMREPHHGTYRKVFQAAFNRTLIESSQNVVEDAVEACFQDMVIASQETRTNGIHPAPYVQRMLFVVFIRLFFGVESGTRFFEQLQALYQRLDIRKAACGSASKETQAAGEIARIISEIADSQLSSGKQGAVSPPCILGELLGRDPDARHDDTIVWNLIYLVQVGRTDMQGLLNWVLKLLVDNPRWIDRLRSASKTSPQHIPTGPDSLPGRVVKETLRLEQSEFLFRRASEDIEFEGYVIPKAWRVRICIREGHRDPDIFEDRDTFNPDRFLSRTYRREEYSPLGVLQHSCLGGQIIDLVGRKFVSGFANGYAATVMHDAPREYGQAHWQPGSAFRINLSPL